jgi:hypothetical protein
MTRARRVPDAAGNHGEQRGTHRPSARRLPPSVAGQAPTKPLMPLASQAEGSRIVVTDPLSELTLVDDTRQ